MEWIRISNNKLKIMLTAEDARHYALNCENADYADTVTRTAFRDILTDVRKQTGFDATEDKVYIQMYPSKEGGCELFVTKIGLLLVEEGSEGKAETPTSPKQRSHTARREETQVSFAFSFEKLPPMLLLCRRLRTDKHAKQSEAWQDDGGKWWLLFKADKKELTYLHEYGTECNAQAAKLFLAEHGHPICSAMAIETLGKL